MPYVEAWSGTVFFPVPFGRSEPNCSTARSMVSTFGYRAADGHLCRGAPMTGTMTDEALWSVSDLAKFLKMSKSWVYQSSAAGLIPCVRIGAALRFEPEAIRNWLRGESSARVIQLPSCR